MTAGPSGSFEVLVGLALGAWPAADGAAMEVVETFEGDGDGDAAIIVTPRIANIAIANARFGNVGKGIRDRNRVAIDRRKSMLDSEVYHLTIRFSASRVRESQRSSERPGANSVVKLRGWRFNKF